MAGRRLWRKSAPNGKPIIVKTPKLQFIDAGLPATLLDLNTDAVVRDRSRFGAALETFVFAELIKHASVAEGEYRLLYYRDHDQVEVDLVVENAAGRLIGIEVKSASTVRPTDLRGLKRLADLAGDAFRLGVILYDGSDVIPMGDRFRAVPLSTLWGL